MLEVTKAHKRHCWECLRRCVVCDFTEPACKRCSASDTVCPGYGDVKPTRLRWLEPGRVKFRPKSLKALKASKGSKENALHEAVTKSSISSIFNHVIVLPVGVFSESGALIQAAQYCKSSPSFPNTIPHRALTFSNRQRLHISTYDPNQSTRAESSCISHFTRTSPTGDGIPSLLASRHGLYDFESSHEPIKGSS